MSDALGDPMSPRSESAPAPFIRPRWAPLTLVAFVGLVICGYVATALTASWSNDHPALFLALSARVRNLLLALGGGLDPIPYVLIGASRILIAYVVCHLIGRAYGTAILDVFGRYMGVKREQIEGIFESLNKLEWFVLPVFVGSNVVAAITGIQRMSFRHLAPYLAVGIAGRLALYYWLSRVFEDELDRVLGFFKSYTRPALIVSVVLVIVMISVNTRKGRGFKF